jgi:uncharacterized protein (TIGR00661 family)
MKGCAWPGRRGSWLDARGGSAFTARQLPMARILYGVMGNTYGHVMRTLAIVEQMPEHEFCFVGGGRVPAALAGKGYRLLEVPVLRTVHRHGRVSVTRVAGQIAGRLRELPGVVRKLGREIESFQPDLAICDREFYLPIACRLAALRCVSLDHSHVLKACRYPVPPSQRLSWSLAMLNDYALFDFTRHHLIVSFFHPPLRRRWRRGRDQDELLPPVLRPAVTRLQPQAGDHVLVYQTSATFRPLLAPLAELKRPVIVYGYGAEAEHRRGNITFKPYDERAILEDLAGCAYAVVNGGHNLICEALYFGKPVLCFPIARLFEQFINAWHVRALGYGDFSTTRRPEPAIFARFESQLEDYRTRIAAAGSFDGTSRVVARVQEVIRDPSSASNQ